MAEMQILKKFSGEGAPHTPPQWGRGHPLHIPHLLRRVSSPSPDAEPSHFSFLSDAYASESPSDRVWDTSGKAKDVVPQGNAKDFTQSQGQPFSTRDCADVLQNYVNFSEEYHQLTYTVGPY